MFWKKKEKQKTKPEGFLEKFAALDLGGSYLYVMVDDNLNFYCKGGKDILFFVNKLEAVIYLMCLGDSKYKVRKYDDLGPIKKLVNSDLQEGKVKPVVAIGYMASIVGGRQFLLGADKQPLLYAMAVEAEEVVNHFDLRLYLIPHIDSGVDLMEIIERLVFSNAASEEKIEDVAKNTLEYIKNTGVVYSSKGMDPVFDKNVTVRNLFMGG